MRHKKSKGEYLAFLSVKYDLKSEDFLAALHQAVDENKTINCGQVSIEFRGKTKIKHAFLIRNSSGIIAQFQVSNDFLLEDRESLGEFMDTDMVRKYLTKKRTTLKSYFIKDIRLGMNHVNLKAKILTFIEPRQTVVRYGENADMAMVLIADGTGTMRLCLWNEEIDSVSVGDTVHIVNAKVSTFKGEKQLILGARGAFSNIEKYKPQTNTPVLLPA
ncbi:MAG TPA: hypothetical protein VK209_09345 [Candidatus Sulfotelmatobacter sp.]|nr:hypothetical protein [Candidatus Sulfotelmatobacter sp.]